MFEELELSRKEDVSEELKPHRIKQNAADVDKVLQATSDTMNHFSPEIDKDHLYNIVTGKAADEETSSYLLRVEEI